MRHTMRSAYKRWLVLHNEEWRAKCRIRVSNWFRHYIRNNCEWDYHIINSIRNYYCRNQIDVDVMDKNQRRTYKGFYTFEISDEELINLQRAEWIK